MNPNEAQLEQERKLASAFVMAIVQKQAPQEVGVFDVICEEFYAAVDEIPHDDTPDEQMFSFSAADFQAYMAGALLWVTTFVVMPFLKQVCEKVIDTTAERSVDGVAKKVQSALKKLKRGQQANLLSTQLDILVPINWADLMRCIKVEGERVGLSSGRAEELATLAVRELSEDQVLLGNLLLTVLRVPVEQSGSRRHPRKE